MGTFNAVVTTGIYCLPSCGGRPNRSNVQTFALAAAAEEAGYRACLRCRPYRAPPAISAETVPALVCRAVRLVVDGALDEVAEEDLGAKLGISGRHLRRLFAKHLGVTPDHLARSTRVHFARRLLDDTDLSIADVAFGAGFGSIRQFNRACRETFRATPGALRARRRLSDRIVTDGGIALRLPFQPPFDWGAMLGWMQARAIAGVELVTEDCYRRIVVIEGDPGVLEISHGVRDELVLRAHLPHWKGLLHIVQRARGIFNLDANVAAANGHLSADPLIGPLVACRPGIRAPGTWDPFEAAVEAVAQEYSRAGEAPRIMADIAARYGMRVAGLHALGLTHTFAAPDELASADLTGLGLSQEGIDAVHALAKAATAPAMSALNVAVAGTYVEAIGASARCAQSLAWRLGDQDAFPGEDPALVRAIARRTGRDVTPEEAQALAEAWQPWRAHAAAYLWLDDLRH
jgi:AraC family transcriptional regulator of adaptative response / DNA-3-methyladenine glycosylase II